MDYVLYGHNKRNSMASKKKEPTGKGSKAKKTDVVKGDKVSFSPASIKQFINEVQVEFKKVVWPDRKVTFGLTGFVMILVALVSIYLGSVDLILGKLVTMVLR
jgi:preprotein translocase subunit SecE